MKRYSYFFSVIYDQPEAIDPRVRRGHGYTIARVVEPAGFGFMDFAIIWDEDYDTRVVWVIERLIERQSIAFVAAIGESEGVLTVFTRGDVRGTPYEGDIKFICENIPNDVWHYDLVALPNSRSSYDDNSFCNDHYVLGICKQWHLTFKEKEFSWPEEHLKDLRPFSDEWRELVAARDSPLPWKDELK